MSTLVHSVPQFGRVEVHVARPGEHSILESLALHIVPGLFIFTLFVILVPLGLRAGLPPMMAVLAAATVGLGFQVWHLFREGRKRNGHWSLEGIVLYRDSMPVWQYLLLVPAFAVLAFLVNGITAPLGSFLLAQFSWLPEWFEVRSLTQLAYYSKPMLTVLFGMNLLINGLAAPVIEELYFRGYLMPRLERFGRATPIVEAALFTLYHFWQPYYWVTQFLSMLPVVVSVSWKRNVKLGIITHALLNIAGAILTFTQLLG